LRSPLFSVSLAISRRVGFLETDMQLEWQQANDYLGWHKQSAFGDFRDLVGMAACIA
jgi:hypothetical protein